MMTSPSVRRYARGEGERHEARGSVMLFKMIGAATGGRLSVMERTLPAGGRMPPPHTHDGDEAYFVLDERVTFHIDHETFEGGPETFVHVPGGVPHTFGNLGGAQARLLVLHAPALDTYFRDLEELWAGNEPPAKEEELALMVRHGLHPVESS